MASDSRGGVGVDTGGDILLRAGAGCGGEEIEMIQQLDRHADNLDIIAKVNELVIAVNMLQCAQVTDAKLLRRHLLGLAQVMSRHTLEE